MQARAYLLKPCPRDDDGAPSGVLADGAEFAQPAPGIPPGIRVSTRSGEDGAPEWAGLVDEATRDQQDLEASPCSLPTCTLVGDGNCTVRPLTGCGPGADGLTPEVAGSSVASG
jgi:hypothetical protein